MSLQHALIWSFVEAEKQFTGYSNTASIIRHCKQKGAGASTSPDDLSPQEKKTQAMWVLDTVRTALNEFEQALIVLKYGQGSINFADAFVQVGLEYPKYEAHVVDLILCNIFQFDQTGRKWNHGSRGWQDYPTVTQIADVAGMSRKTATRWVGEIQKDIHGALFAAELVLKFELERRLILKIKAVA
ncbi:hypothetical protein LVJ82_16985 [Vitreoscilla massiliensis]|uniref:Uncharacterized protein n=2 Tax=Vitreoscilla massiliensis TaxID=1689272 RepID=A0ABY4E0W1_9NEIS|nr:hypothetical protein [Vitreoscilla massiliensis]UOO89114.1 hypothetical protein LVJ82_16985 [Vitreoscilla massiliensis]